MPLTGLAPLDSSWQPARFFVINDRRLQANRVDHRSFAGFSLHNLGSGQQVAAGARRRGRRSAHRSAAGFSCSGGATMCDNADPATLGMLRPTMPEEDRAVDLTMDAQAIARQIRYSDGSPGAPIELCGRKFRAFGAIADVAQTVPLPADVPPGTVLGCRDGAVAVATGDGVVFISHLKCAMPTFSPRGAIKVPAVTALKDPTIPSLPPLSLHYSSSSNAGRKWFLPPVDTYMDLWTQTADGVCYVIANFLNGAMSTTQGKRLEALLKEVGERSNVDAVVFAGGYDAFANGINLNEIEVSNLGLPSPRGENWLNLESWRNINAINDVIKQLFTMTDKVTVSALRGGAGAGGFMAALATDRVWAHSGVVVNPHYRTMGLHGSEYWTHFLPERVGSMEAALRITEGKQAYTAQKAVEMNLIDKVLEANVEKFQQVLHANVMQLVREEKQSILLKKAQKFTTEYVGNLEAARAFELSVMKRDFVSREYNEARRRFVLKEKALATPIHLTNRTGTRMDGRLLAKRLRKKMGAEFAAQLARIPEGTTPPGLGIIQVGSLEDSTMYTNMKVKAAQSMGFTGILKQFDAVEDSYEAVRDQILAWNADPSIDGIMVQKPIPNMGSNADTLLKLIHADKDIDCLNPENFHTVIENTSEAFIEGSSKVHSFMPPCPLGILEMLNAYQVPLKGKAATVIGTSSNLGLPVAMLLVNEGCSVTTVNMQSVSMLKESLENADIVIAAANSPNLITPDMIKYGVVIVDAGICKDPETAKLCGAVATECGALSKLISPVPGGVGPMTVAMLLNNLWRSWKYKHGLTA